MAEFRWGEFLKIYYDVTVTFEHCSNPDREGCLMSEYMYVYLINLFSAHGAKGSWWVAKKKNGIVSKARQSTYYQTLMLYFSLL